MTHLSRRALFQGSAAIVAGSAAATLTPAAARAEAATPVPPVSRRKIGTFEVTAIVDGYLDVGTPLFAGIQVQALDQAIADSFLPASGAVRLGITSYVVNTGDRLVLVDTGSAGFFGPTAGRFRDALAAVGITPDMVDDVLITHLHPDHSGAMTDGTTPYFPRAAVHVSELDQKFWADPANLAGADEGVKPWFQAAQDLTAAYAGRLNLFAGEPELLPGITAVALPGHTPGHTGFHLASGDEQLLIWGDACGIASVQFSHPDAGLIFDVDAVQGRATRRKLLDMAAADRLLVAGAHLPFPSFGHVRREGDAYAWAPEEWQFL